MLAERFHDMMSGVAVFGFLTKRLVTMTPFAIRVCALTAVLLGVSSPALRGQRPEDVRRPGKRSEPIRVALVTSDALLGGSHVRVLRRVNFRPHDVILVDPQATPRDLAAGIQLLTSLRAQFGDSLQHDLRAVPTSDTPPADWRGSPYEAWMGEQLARLRSARTYAVDGIGSARAVSITVPAAFGSRRPVTTRRR